MSTEAAPVSPRRRAADGPAFAVQLIGTLTALGTAIWVSTHLHPSPTLHGIALFAHLSALVFGFGAVLLADYFVLLWLLGRADFAETIATIGRLHPPIWLGLAGLVASGTLLEPNLAATATRVKLALVLVVAVNGLQATALGTRMAAAGATPGPGLLARGALTALVSHLCWWGAMGIGFWTTRS
ncbi:hypothetical protein [Nocardia sp. NPDC050710]|uniref:hypothetical protein n=1 Tax=Nocardia sp. NPDC050710 TaxID=3157220 RepID=UPI0034069487